MTKQEETNCWNDLETMEKATCGLVVALLIVQAESLSFRLGNVSLQFLNSFRLVSWISFQLWRHLSTYPAQSKHSTERVKTSQ